MAEPPDFSATELTRSKAELTQALARYDALRSRKAVRVALAIAELRHTARELLDRRHRPMRTAPPAASVVLAAEPAEQTPPPEPVAPVPEVAHCWPLGHFYSPVPDTVALARVPSHDRVWPSKPPQTPGIDWRDAEQVALVRDVIARQPELAFATGPTGDPKDYHTGNEFFSRLDAWALQGVLRWLRPARLIEVGSGWSSLVAARVNREYLDGAMDLTCIEPYPAGYLCDGVPGLTRLVPSQVQDVPIETFLELGPGDVLFIDSSHVVKTGSDAQYLYHDVIPRLRSGVVVHIHDIFLPWDYPEDWVMTGRGWNEQYLLRSFLAFNDSFEVVLAIGWMCQFHADTLKLAIAGFPDATPDGGGSFWMRRR